MTGTMVGAVLRGIRSRSLLSVGSVLLILLAIGSAMLGPVFQVAVTKSYVVTRLNEAPPRATGVSRLLVPDPGFPGGPQAGVDLAVEEAVARDQGPFAAPTTQLETTRVEGGVNNPDGTPGMVRLLAKDGACDHLEITGRCPTSPGQALVLGGDAEYAGLEIGDQIPLTGGLPNVTMVGTYRVPAAEEEFWYDVTRFDSVPRNTDDISGDVDPYMPGPLVVAGDSFDAVPDELWRVRVDHRRRRTPRLDRRRPVGRGALGSGGRRRPGADRERVPGRRRARRPAGAAGRGALPGGHRPQLHRPGRPVARAGRPRPAHAAPHGRERASACPSSPWPRCGA